MRFLFFGVFLSLVSGLFYYIVMMQGQGFYEVIRILGMAMPIFATWIAAMMAEQQHQDDSRLMFTMDMRQPIRRVLGRLGEGALLMMCALVLTLVFPLAIALGGGEISLLQLAPVYLGLLLLGLSYVALGCMFCVLLPRQAAWLCTLVTTIALYPLLGVRFESFTKGLVYASDIGIFMSVALVAVFVGLLYVKGQPGKPPVIITAALAIAIGNIALAELGFRADLSQGRVYTPAGKNITSRLDKPIDIYALFPYNTRERHFDIARELLLEYAKSPNINLHFAKWPGEGAPPAGGIMVTNGERTKIVPPHKMFLAFFDEDAMQMDITSLRIEEELANALLYVNSERDILVAHITAHGEDEFSEVLEEAFISFNYGFVTADVLPIEADILFITTPTQDWEEQALQWLDTHLEEGGGIVFALDPPILEYPRLAGFLNAHGVELGGRFLAEGEGMYIGSEGNLLVAQTGGAVRNNSREQRATRVLAPNAQAIRLGEGLRAWGGLRTSPGAKERTNPWEQQRPDRGVHLVGAGVEAQNGNKMVVLGSSLVLDESADALSGGANYAFITTALDWLSDAKQHNVRIPAKGI